MSDDLTQKKPVMKSFVMNVVQQLMPKLKYAQNVV